MINIIGQETKKVSYKDFKDTANNKEMWCKGDKIVVLNKSGLVISVSELKNDGTKCELSNAPLKECDCPLHSAHHKN